MTKDQLKYPIGKFSKWKNIGDAVLEQWINDIESFPDKLDELTRNLTAEQLQLRYRPDGWTIKQVVHHCADSHMNSLIRFKLALTEDEPTIRPYFEDRWANLVDAQDDDIRYSVGLLKALHSKWILLLRSLDEADLNREFIHPEHDKRFTLRENISIYAWHGEHHLAHIRQALDNEIMPQSDNEVKL